MSTVYPNAPITPQHPALTGYLALAYSFTVAATRPIGELSVAAVRDDPALVEAVARITGLPEASVRRQLGEASGNLQVATLFQERWSTGAPSADRVGGSEPGHTYTQQLPPALFANDSDGSVYTSQRHDNGIETEDVSTTEIDTPFDPNEIRVRLWTPTVDLVLTRLREKEIDLAPDFQRAAGIWKERTQSRLIESLLIRVPLPAFYMDSADEDKLLVIDGIQRLTALKRFVTDHDLVLRDLEYLTDYNGKRFTDLPRPFRRRIEETMLTVHVIDKGTPDGAKLNIFKRLNTGGMPLTSQEVRHAMSPGPVRGFLKGLAESNAFREATQERFADNRMTDRECALRFCAFVLTAPSEYPGGDLDNFLLDTMRTINAMTPMERSHLASRFERALIAAEKVLREQAFRKPRPPGRPRPPVNKALFEAWTVGFEARSDEEIVRLIRSRDEVQAQFEALVENSREFEQALSQGTGDKKKVKLRFGAINSLLADVANPVVLDSIPEASAE